MHHYHKKTTEQQIVETILKGLWWLVSAPFKLLFGGKKTYSGKHSYQGGGLDQQFMTDKWQQIEQLIKLGQPSNNAKAILEADKLLDHVLKSLRVPGLTMGDRLKTSRKRFSPEAYDAAWKAHKVRNEIVHNTDFEIMGYHAEATINNYKKAIDELIK